MSAKDMPRPGTDGALLQEYRLDAPPAKVWRAVSLPAFREAWLPSAELAAEAPVAAEPGEAVSYRLRDPEPPHRESVVTFRLLPEPDGGTRLRILQRPATSGAANCNAALSMRAA
ncbi:SRPBCC domain-containing protein [Poseidonocella sp. HB161398]|uniref:SRPBCC family protein n=1 Tax=Poseidonocella sp. HB161398 TaxID=2320855 RepID=UPI00197FA830|nr:hypothetical protein [Poseidonocella sp. HB161398]